MLAHKHICTLTHTHTHPSSLTHTHIHTHTHARTHARTHTRTHTQEGLNAPPDEEDIVAEGIEPDEDLSLISMFKNQVCVACIGMGMYLGM